MKISERYGDPDGGYTIYEFHGADGKPCAKEQAVGIEVKKYNGAGKEIARTYATVEKEEQQA